MKLKLMTLLITLAPFSSFAHPNCDKPNGDQPVTAEAKNLQTQEQILSLIKNGILIFGEDGQASISDDGHSFINELQEKGLLYESLAHNKTICF